MSRKKSKKTQKVQQQLAQPAKKPQQGQQKIEPAKKIAKDELKKQDAKVSANNNLNRPKKIPEALPLKSEKISGVKRFTSRLLKKPPIQEVVREPTAGGIVYRNSADGKDIDILLIQDSKGRWTIPKGHIEPGETARQTAIREIGEEAGLFHIEVVTWLGKIHFQYRRINKLVLMMTQIYLVRALDVNETPHKEQWMRGIKWFRFNDAINAIEYEDIEKLMLVARNKIRQGVKKG